MYHFIRNRLIALIVIVMIMQGTHAQINTRPTDDHRKVLDRLVEEYRIKDEQTKLEQQRVKDYKVSSQTPLMEWESYYAFMLAMYLTSLIIAATKANNLREAVAFSGGFTLFMFIFTFIFQAKLNFLNKNK